MPTTTKTREPVSQILCVQIIRITMQLASFGFKSLFFVPLYSNVYVYPFPTENRLSSGSRFFVFWRSWFKSGPENWLADVRFSVSVPVRK
jgi:hypothetical protein